MMPISDDVDSLLFTESLSPMESHSCCLNKVHYVSDQMIKVRQPLRLRNGLQNLEGWTRYSKPDVRCSDFACVEVS